MKTALRAKSQIYKPVLMIKKMVPTEAKPLLRTANTSCLARDFSCLFGEIRLL